MIRAASPTATLSAPQAYALGHELREAREQQGLTRGQVAVTADFLPAWVTQIEGGEIHDLETLRTYARVLGTRIKGTRAARLRRS